MSAETASRLSAPLVAIAVLLVGCTPTMAGPPPARPAPDPVVTTLTVPPPSTTTTTIPEDEGCSSLCLEYHLNSRATWSDGAPVLAADFAYTFAVHANSSVDRDGYELVRELEIIDDSTFRLHLAAPYGAWQSLFSRVYRDGSDLDDVESWDTTGPFRLSEWADDGSLTLERNLGWWASDDPLSGEAAGDVSEVRVVFFESPADMVEALVEGSVDVIVVRPDEATVQRLEAAEDVDFEMAPGPFWEHIGFHHDDDLLARPWVREAFSMAIDRESILDRTVRLIAPDTEGLDSTIWMANSLQYESHFPDRYGPERAEQILVENGCARGDDGIQVCEDRRMSFRWATTDDEGARREIFESAREDLEAVGIEVLGDFRSPSTFVSRDFLFGDSEAWQIVNFSWRGGPDPSTSSSTYLCGDAGVLNVNRYCSEAVEDLVRAAESTMAPAERAALYNSADSLYLEDIAVIPLYQRPVMSAWREGIGGPEPNHSMSSDLWNVAAWSGPSTIVVGLMGEPDTLNPRSRGDDSANAVLGAMLFGAFGVTPSHEYVPVLVDRVEVAEGGR